MVSTVSLYPGYLPARLLLLVVCLLSVVTVAASDPLLTDMALVKALRAGGYNLYFRHVGTEWSQSDAVREAEDWRSCDPARMRQLSGAGRRDAQAIGVAMRRLDIPVAEVLASPYCRTVETAQLLGLGKVNESTLVMNLRSADYFGGRASIVASARSLLASEPQDGSNRVIVAHGNVAREATPVYPDEGEGLVFQSDGAGGFSLRGRIRVDDWTRLVELATD
jgi:phosphohistidine phosphatase SixA